MGESQKKRKICQKADLNIKNLENTTITKINRTNIKNFHSKIIQFL